jgi:2'-5' RNA ligase
MDEILVAELAHPGSDVRCGVNLICRPPDRIVDLALSIQSKLRQLESHQYFYPAADLHLTVLEFSHSRSAAEAEDIVGTVRVSAPTLFADLPRFELVAPVLTSDARAVALRFNPADERLSILRSRLRARAEELRIPRDARYLQSSAHVTLMRYVAPMAAEPVKWARLIESGVENENDWTASALWMTWGANWYGMRSRIKEAGPYALV